MKMTILKRALSLALCFIMAFSLCTPAFAVEEQAAGAFGTAQAFTQGLAVEGEEELVITNKETVTLGFSRADSSIGRWEDGWWAGTRIFAPEGLTTEQIKSVKYRKWNGTGWDEPKLFWGIKDSKDNATVHYFDSWMRVTPEIIEKDEDKKLSVIYEFDWDNDGFDTSTQKVSFVLDVENIKLDMTPFLGTAAAITNGLTVEGKEEITVINNEEVTLYFSKADPSIGRKEDGWWAGMKVIAPAGLTEKELKNAKYLRTDANGTAEKVFWNVKDSADNADVHYVEMWVMVTPELIKNATDNKLTTTYVFDWYGNGFDGEVQTYNFVLDTAKLNLDHKDYYGTASGITEGLTVTGEKDIVIKNEEEITVDFSLKDESVGRYMDAWWIGVKLLAPEGMTVEQLKEATYNNGTGAKSFWQFKDSADDADVHYITVWVPVIQDYIDNDADGILNWKYEFDWDGNGYGISTQKFTISIDANKINRTHEAGCKKVVESDAVAPDCINNGKNEKSYCSVCGLVLGDGADVEALGHDFTEVIINDSHLKEKGEGQSEYYYNCSRCDVMSEEDTHTVIDADINNKFGDISGFQCELTVEGTDTAKVTVKNDKEFTLDFVLKDESIGRNIDAWWVGVKVLAPKGMTNEELANATLKNYAGYTYNFMDCKDTDDNAERHFVTFWLPITQQSIDESENGILTYTCEFDWDGNGYGISTQKIDITVDTNKINRTHEAGCADVLVAEKVDPTCEGTGREEIYSCEICGLVKGGEEIPATGHNYSSAVTAPTCTAAGYTTYTCTVCGDTYTADEVSALGHEYGSVVTAPTCTAGGYTTYTCTVCGDTYTADKVPALGHTAGKAVTENDVKPTCKNKGSYETVVYCTVCDAQISRVKTTVSALGHDYSEKIIDSKHLYKAKTCTTYAKYYYDCTRCDEMTSTTFENKAEGLLAHKKTVWTDSRYLASAATCEKQGWYYMGCLTCDTVFKNEKIDKYPGETTYIDAPKGHLFIVEKVTTPASINKIGYTNFFCEDCGKMDADKIPFAAIKTVALSGTSFSYTGKEIKPSVTVKDTDGKVLKSGTDYTVAYTSNIAPGKATATVTFKGSYTGSTTLSFTIGQLPATQKITYTSAASSVTLTWEKVANASGYKVYIKTSDGWKEIGSTTNNSLKVTKNAAGKTLSSGKEYSFMVKAYAKHDSKLYVSDASKSIVASTMAAATSKVTVSQTTSTITLKWNAVEGADSYNVYKYNTKTKKYVLYKNVKGRSITIKKLTGATSYKYLIRAVTVVSDKTSVIGATKYVVASTKPATPKVSVSTKSTTATVKWDAVKGATGYEVYMKTGSGEAKLIGTVKGSKTSFAKKKLKAGKKYTFTVRAYRTVDGSKIYSAYGKKVITVKK